LKALKGLFSFKKLNKYRDMGQKNQDIPAAHVP